MTTLTSILAIELLECVVWDEFKFKNDGLYAILRELMPSDLFFSYWDFTQPTELIKRLEEDLFNKEKTDDFC